MTSQPPTPPAHIGHGTDQSIVLLKSADFGAAAGQSGELPYRIDLLGDHGFSLVWTDRHHRFAWRPLLTRIEAATVPFAQALLTRRARRDGAAVLAIFESEGHGLALHRRLTGRRRPPLVIVACWLADLLVDGTAWRRSLYRYLYRAVDDVVVFSSNQRDTLAAALGRDPDRIHVVRFGVDLDELAAVTTSDDGGVVAVGRDLGRDWNTLARASEGTGWQISLFTRPAQVDGIDLPPEIHLRGPVDRSEYLRELAGAAVVAVPTLDRQYPTGQTVLLEAMALGKACVVTDTVAMREYVQDGVTALMVPPGDAEAFRSAVQRLLDDPALRERLGDEARTVERRMGGAATMWRDIAAILQKRTADVSAAPKLRFRRSTRIVSPRPDHGVGHQSPSDAGDRVGEAHVNDNRKMLAPEYPQDLVDRIVDYYGHDREVLAGPASRIAFMAERTLPELRSCLGPLDDLAVLDYGCGTASSSVALRTLAGRVEGFDIDHTAVELGRERLRAHGFDDVPLYSGDDAVSAGVPGGFDIVLMNAVIERVPTKQRAAVLADATSRLRPGGVLVIAQSPNRWWPRDVYLTGLWFLPWLPVGSRLAARYANAAGTQRGTISPTRDGGRSLEFRGIWGITFPQIRRALPPGTVCLNAAPDRRTTAMVTLPSSRRRHIVELVLGSTVTPLLGIPVAAFGPMFSLLAFRLPSGSVTEDASNQELSEAP